MGSNDMRLDKPKLWRIVVYVGAVSIVSLLIWYLGILAGLAALAIPVLEKLPEWRSWAQSRLELRRLREVSGSIASACIIAIERDFPFLETRLSREKTAGYGVEYGFLDSRLPMRIAEQVIVNLASYCPGTVSPQALACVILKRTLSKSSPEARILVRDAVADFLSEQVSFKSDEVQYTKNGSDFLRLVQALEGGPLASHIHVEKALVADLDREIADNIAFSILDPRLLYLITRLGKASSLEDLLHRPASGRRILSFLKRKDRSSGTKADRQYYLVLKQEYRQGRMDIKKRIDTFPDRITTTGWIYSGGEMKSKYQSISILPSPVKYANARQFLARHFQAMQHLTEAERKRASIVAIPIDVDGACVLPSGPERLLDRSHFIFLSNWLDFFRVGTESKLATGRPDFELTVNEILSKLSIDFLIKNPTPGEVDFFRRNSTRILKRLELKSLFELHKVAPAALLRATKETGLPSYWPRDLENFTEDDSVPFSRWLDRRLTGILREATRTANHVSRLAAHPQL